MMGSGGASRSDVAPAVCPVETASPADRGATGLNDLYAAVVNSARDAIITCHPDMRISTWNRGAERLFGHSTREALSGRLTMLASGDEGAALQANFETALAGTPVMADAALCDRDGGRLDVSVALTAIRRGDDTIGVAAIIRDMRRRRRAEAADHLLATIVRHSSDAVFSIDTERHITAWNPAAERLYGYSAQEALGCHVAVLVPPAHRHEIDEMYQAVLGDGETVQFDTQRQRKDGTLVDVSISGAPLLTASGEVFGISLIHRNITEQRRQQEQTRFIMRELAHRSKNLLAIILSMASQTARGARSVPDFTTRFTQRLQGLSHSHDLLLQRDWRGVSMLELAERQLQHFVDGESNRVGFRGPMVMVDPKAAQNLGLALHELATNASKYGALSTSGGRVTLNWAVIDGRFRLEWREFGGPPVTPPETRGFGQVVLERLASDALEGQVKLDYAADGFVWTLDIPATYLVDEVTG
jgi:PAS domain S-box-containing protein